MESKCVIRYSYDTSLCISVCRSELILAIKFLRCILPCMADHTHSIHHILAYSESVEEPAIAHCSRSRVELPNELY